MPPPKASTAQKALSLIAERRLPWRLNRWLEQRRLDATRSHFDKEVLITRPCITGEEFPHFEIHVLLGHKHVGMTLWCVKSLLHHSGRKYSVVLHEDGSLTDSDVSVLEKHLINAKIIRRPAADEAMRRKLAHLPNAMKYRFSPKETSDHRGVKYDMHVFALRLFDFNLLTEATKILVLDCDVLFFKRPQQIMHWAEDTDRRGSLYSIEQYVPVRDVRNEIIEFRYKNPQPVDANAGLLCLDKRIYDLDAIEAWIGKNLEHMDRLATFEQHAYNHLLKTSPGGAALPDSYSFNYTDESVVATHFAIKHLFFGNLPRLKPALTSKDSSGQSLEHG